MLLNTENVTVDVLASIEYKCNQQAEEQNEP